MDRQHIIDTFNAYTSNYHLEDPKIKLKYDHTFRVAAFCQRIANSLELSQDDVDLAWVLGMFHDIGRFEQVRRYHTFKDKDSVDHASLSADLLFNENLIDEYLTNKEEFDLSLMEKAIRFHNRYLLPEDLTERERLFCNILRDADKVDILRVNCETPREDIYDLPTEAFTMSDMTDEVYEAAINHEEVNRKYSKTGIDFIIGHIGFVYGLVFDESKKMVKEQGYLDELLNFESKNPVTCQRMQEIKRVIKEYLS